METQIDALDITVLKGGGDEVGTWARDNGFLLTPDAPEVLDYYSERSEIFMAARFDADRAAALGQTAGQGTPIMLTIPTDAPWVPLRILGLGLDGSEVVEADVFLLTDDEPSLLAGGSGLTVDRSEQASQPLLADLRSDVGMEWVPDDMWLSYLQLEAPAADLDYDLAVSADGDSPTLADTGVKAPEVEPVTPDRERSTWPLGGWGRCRHLRRGVVRGPRSSPQGPGHELVIWLRRIGVGSGRGGCGGRRRLRGRRRRQRRRSTRAGHCHRRDGDPAQRVLGRSHRGGAGDTGAVRGSQ